MNIIYIHTHDSGRFWSPYGYNMPTPNIMDFAQTATVFRHCYCAGPTCSPSRAGLLTGMNSHSNGMQGLASRGWQLNDYNQHLVSHLKGNGYQTILCGIQHEAPDYNMIGYDHVVGSQEFNMNSTENSMEQWDYDNCDCICNFLNNYKEEAPFFLSFGLFNTHREFPVADHKTFNPDYIVPPAPLYDCDINRKDMADYMASVKVVDDCVGQVLTLLDEKNIADDTMVILTTDHGIAFPKMKCTLLDTGIGVALIVRYPDNKLAGKATDALVSQLDVFPTICELIGTEKPYHLEGVSLVPIFQGETTTVRDCIFSEVTYHAAYEPKRCVRTDRYKLIRYFDFHNGIVPANIDECPSKDLLMENGHMDTKRPREVLYDLLLDPSESHDISQNPTYSAIYDELSTKLETWMKSTDDPILRYGSRIPMPVGAQVNPLNCLNPRLLVFE